MPTEGLDDFERAATITGAVRAGTIRALTDCLIAGVAIRADVDLLHAERDFERSPATELRLFAGPHESMMRIVRPDRLIAIS